MSARRWVMVSPEWRCSTCGKPMFYCRKKLAMFCERRHEETLRHAQLHGFEARR